ncbi:hypothetical protein [Aequorivita viscosa]|uniref:Lipoprotein n=1 Tax=Aequorivita viscosa TaxID=797419 RepID=A0A1M6K0U8_9FLAO|nr:hypothetical protein [Aequorivita viscosa]SDW59011.1 hypothetical protein SAMN05216556_10780 [Aequorivita viscosa]SHJ52606.1 hypothetical protein SAMN04487908_1193 [Aequorivita viscosa]
MKYLLCSFLMFFVISCEENHQKFVNNIEELLNVELNYDYQIKNQKDTFGFGKYSTRFDMVFNIQDFNSLLKILDLQKFRKIDFRELGIPNDFNYSRSYSNGNVREEILISIKMRTLRYSRIDK